MDLPGAKVPGVLRTVQQVAHRGTRACRTERLPPGSSVNGGEFLFQVCHLRATRHQTTDLLAPQLVGNTSANDLAEAEKGVTGSLWPPRTTSFA